MEERRPLRRHWKVTPSARGGKSLPSFKGTISSFILRRGFSPFSAPAPSLHHFSTSSSCCLQPVAPGKSSVSEVNGPWPWRKHMKVILLGITAGAGAGGYFTCVGLPAHETAALSCNSSAPRHQAANGFQFRFNF